MTFTFIKFKNALAAQGISRDDLPHKGFWQPYTAWYALTATTIMCFVGGYTVFLPGNWDVPTFLFSYICHSPLYSLGGTDSGWPIDTSWSFFSQYCLSVGKYSARPNGEHLRMWTYSKTKTKSMNTNAHTFLLLLGILGTLPLLTPTSLERYTNYPQKRIYEILGQDFLMITHLFMISVLAASNRCRAPNRH